MRHNKKSTRRNYKNRTHKKHVQKGGMGWGKSKSDKEGVKHIEKLQDEREKLIEDLNKLETENVKLKEENEKLKGQIDNLTDKLKGGINHAKLITDKMDAITDGMERNDNQVPMTDEIKNDVKEIDKYLSSHKVPKQVNQSPKKRRGAIKRKTKGKTEELKNNNSTSLTSGNDNGLNEEDTYV